MTIKDERELGPAYLGKAPPRARRPAQARRGGDMHRRCTTGHIWCTWDERIMNIHTMEEKCRPSYTPRYQNIQKRDGEAYLMGRRHLNLNAKHIFHEPWPLRTRYEVQTQTRRENDTSVPVYTRLWWSNSGQNGVVPWLALSVSRANFVSTVSQESTIIR